MHRPGSRLLSLPVAIIGRSIALPGDLWTPEALYAAVRAGRDLTSAAPPGRWSIDPADALGAGQPDRAGNDRGGYLGNLEDHFDPASTGLDPAMVRALDPLFWLTLSVVQGALRDAKLPTDARPRPRVGAILGNLSFPAASLARFAEETWLGPEASAALGRTPVHPANRFMSGLPVQLLRAAFGLQGPLFALDAACASSLYAIRMAIDALQDGRADIMLAGAVNRCDDLFIHVGFSALQALSKTGQSRPFHADADGLLPAEGGGVVVLKRLDDALAAGDTIHGVIRGVGLSNDGRGRGLLVPSAEGQTRAMAAAWELAGLDPADAGLLECHATGTPVGDATEIASSAAVFAAHATKGGLPVGSLKSNLGHLITAAGVAGLVKVLEALRHRERPPSRPVEKPTAALSGTPFRLLQAPEAWTGPLRAGISAFGFGGNNAHLVVEDLSETLRNPPPPRPDLAPVRVVITGIGARAAGVSGAHALVPALEQAAARAGEPTPPEPLGDITLPVQGLRTPPKDLDRTLAQQTALLAAADEAWRQTGGPRGPRTAILVGMGADPQVARYGYRWRLPGIGRALRLDTASVEQLRETAVPALDSAGVLGTMPNIPANRINAQLDLGGPSLTLSAEQLSGNVAFDIAVRALASGELDVALVGAVDLSCEPVHTRALATFLTEAAKKPGDAAVVLVLEREDQARAAGRPILAHLATPAGHPAEAPLTLGEGGLRIEDAFGHAHAAEGLLRIAVATALLAQGAAPAVRVRTTALGGGQAEHLLQVGDVPGLPENAAPGPSLRLPSHPPLLPHPRLPQPSAPLPMMAAPAPREVVLASRSMPPAPTLPSTRGAPVSLDMPVLIPGHAPEPARAAAPQAPTVPTAPLARDLAVLAPVWEEEGAAAGWRREMARIGAVHQQFLETQGRLHQQFLSLSRTLPAGLATADVGAEVWPAPEPTPVPSISPTEPTVSHPEIVLASVPPTTPVAPRAQPVVAPPAFTPPPPTAAVAPPPTAPAAVLPKPKTATQPVGAKKSPVGPTFDRAALQIHAGGTISSLFGPQFVPQDAYLRQCRMPEPPLLLADRVLGIDAEPATMGLGTIWTETDVTEHSWYLHQGRMPAGVLIETGQADLMLISYLGIDLQHPGDRVYRLLGCTLTYHGDLPSPGETLRYDIHVDGHARHGEVRLFFFHYDSVARKGDQERPMLSVRGGQAGFFTDAELEDSAGILWRPEDQKIVAEPRLDPFPLACTATSFTAAQVRAYAEGRPFECFGAPWYRTRSHTDTPRIQTGKMLFFGDVTHFSPQGGPWGRGYLRAIREIQPDDWFFEGHFKNDACMPGTLMFEGCLQAMAFYLAATGVTAERDGWRFQPVPEAPFDLKCRGQIDPDNKLLIYEVFVEEFIAGPVPTLWADLLCTSDNLKAFHARRVGLQLVPDWPLGRRPELLHGFSEAKPVATHEGFAFGYPSLLACAWGRPSDAFGKMYEIFDGHRRVARLPGPPYHFMTRVTRIDGRPGDFRPGQTIELEYDVPRDAWYFGENDNPTMPFCVFLEAALQPCGWLASMVGSATTVAEDLSFRNLDGNGTMLAEIPPEGGVFRTVVTITNISKTAGMIIESFDVGCYLGETKVYDLKTVFGFFPKAALENQVGLPTTPAQREILSLRSEVFVDLRGRPAAYFAGDLRLPGPMLCMIDRVSGYWPTGGKAGLGAARAEKDVDPGEWFFAAHFYQDPVQPGSLGIEAMIRLLQWVMIETGAGNGMKKPRFEPLRIGAAMSWKYRGQVVPHNKVISSTLEITERGTDARGVYAIADCSLWVDGKRIYEASGLGMRVVDDGGLPPGPWCGPGPDTLHLDPAVDTWVADHAPTFTVPALPMTVLADLLAQGAEGEVRRLEGVRVRRWALLDQARTFRREELGRVPGGRRLRLVDQSDGGVVAEGTVYSGEILANPLPWPTVRGEVQPDPYASGQLFHGPAFAALRHHIMGTGDFARQAEGEVDLDALSRIPRGRILPGLLDAATHILPHDALHRWTSRIGENEVAYPAILEKLEIFGPAPTGGRVRVVARLIDAAPGRARFALQLSQAGKVWAEFTLMEASFPKGSLGSAPPAARRAFLQERRGNGQHLSTQVTTPTEGGTSAAPALETHLSPRVAAASDWLPGTLRAVYGSADPKEIAWKEHIAALASRDGAGPHPGHLPAALPLADTSAVVVEEQGGEIQVKGPIGLDLRPVRDYWRNWFGLGAWPVEDLFYGLMERYLGQVILEDPASFASLKGKSVLFLANHQTGVESLLFSIIAGALVESPTVTVAKAEHRQTWLGDLIRHSFTWPDARDPGVITYFEREDKASLIGLIAGLADEMRAGGRSVMVHVEGTRSFDCTAPVQKMSGAFVDMALSVGAPIVPVRFVGGLPRTPLDIRTEMPVGHGRQDIWIGRALWPEDLARMPYGDRKKKVLAGINRLGPEVEHPYPWPDATLAETIATWSSRTGCRAEHSALRAALQRVSQPCPETRALLSAVDLGIPLEGTDPVANFLNRLWAWMTSPTAGQI